MKPGRRVLLYVQHLLGVGHLKRCAVLAGAMTRAGLEVTVVSGGFSVSGLTIDAARFIQLPPAGAGDLGFKTLVDERGVLVDEAWKEERRRQLLAAWRDTAPQVLLVELFPFGRRQMRFELLPLLAEAREAALRPVIACSVRDVLGGGQKDPARADWILATFETYFDHLLVHGDPALVPFDRTFRHAARLGDRLHYTGYVVEPAGLPERAPASPGPGLAEVLVSAGGGAVGQPLLEAAIRARALSALSQHPWRVLAGVNASGADLQSLTALAGAEAAAGGIVVERHRADFAARLAHCALSISQGGYNTVMEILRARARAVVVPFAGGQEIEQSLRATWLAERGWLEVVDEAHLSPKALAQAVARALARERPAAPVVALDGAERSAALVARWAQAAPW